ncbi:MAG: hypothetical protein ACOYJL_04320 [Tractidigestivibacter sp.]|uniref:hypothetical protein n=1 Tax=Tractidigestivibacter sp. TaxID=2847320 RepID=UPI003D943C6D
MGTFKDRSLHDRVLETMWDQVHTYRSGSLVAKGDEDDDTARWVSPEEPMLYKYLIEQAHDQKRYALKLAWKNRSPRNSFVLACARLSISAPTASAGKRTACGGLCLYANIAARLGVAGLPKRKATGDMQALSQSEALAVISNVDHRAATTIGNFLAKHLKAPIACPSAKSCPHATACSAAIGIVSHELLREIGDTALDCLPLPTKQGHRLEVFEEFSNDLLYSYRLGTSEDRARLFDAALAIVQDFLKKDKTSAHSLAVSGITPKSVEPLLWQAWQRNPASKRPGSGIEDLLYSCKSWLLWLKASDWLNNHGIRASNGAKTVEKSKNIDDDLIQAYLESVEDEQINRAGRLYESLVDGEATSEDVVVPVYTDVEREFDVLLVGRKRLDRQLVSTLAPRSREHVLICALSRSLETQDSEKNGFRLQSKSSAEDTKADKGSRAVEGLFGYQLAISQQREVSRAIEEFQDLMRPRSEKYQELNHDVRLPKGTPASSIGNLAAFLPEAFVDDKGDAFAKESGEGQPPERA